CPNPNFYEVETDPKVCGFSTKSVTVNNKNQKINFGDQIQRKFVVPVDCSKPILSVDNLPTGYYYPIQSNFVYEKIGNVNDKVVVTSSNTKIIPDIGSIRLEQSQASGYAVIKSGQNTGKSDISVSIEGIGSRSLEINVIDTKSHNTTKIFSPLGNDEIFLNGNGEADIFVIPFDFAGRPKKMFEDTDYILKPANSVFHLGKNKSFLKTEFPIDQKTIGNTNQFNLAQIGTMLTQSTDTSQNFFINSTSHILMTLPNPNLTSQQMDDLAMVQLVDSDGNPIVTNKDTTIMISSSDERIVSIPNSAIIPAGFSYGFFTINTLDVQGTTTLTATGKGLDSKSLVVNTMPSESRLGISIDSSPESLTPKTPSKIQFSVFDSNQKSIEGANVEIYSSD
ncbi:MAG: hypothetical protein ACKO7N_07065, partial [Candidatus Nitrosotenuis sp.]